MDFEEKDIQNGPNDEVDKDEMLDNSTYWLDIDPETGKPDLSSVRGATDFIDQNGNHDELNEDGEYVLTVPGQKDD